MSNFSDFPPPRAQPEELQQQQQQQQKHRQHHQHQQPSSSSLPRQHPEYSSSSSSYSAARVRAAAAASALRSNSFDLETKPPSRPLAAPKASSNNAQPFFKPGLASLSAEHLALSPRDRLNLLLNKPLESTAHALPPSQSSSTLPSSSTSPSASSSTTTNVSSTAAYAAPASKNPAATTSAPPRQPTRSVSDNSIPARLHTSQLPSHPVPPPTTKSPTSAMPSSAASERALPSRNFSVDSTTSAASSVAPPAPPPVPATVHSSQSSISSSVSSPPTSLTQPSPAALVASAGGAEAAIEKLLQEQRAQSVRSEQLWRLVEKQRAMLLGLNKDLERALKDKERYRKKFMDLQQSSDASASRDQRHTHGKNSPSGASTSHRNLASVESTDSALLLARGQVARDVRDTDTTHERTDSKLSHRADTSSAATAAPQNTLPPVNTVRASDVKGKDGGPKTPRAHAAAASVSSPSEKRKAAPAPLDLTHAKPTSPIEATHDVIDSDSDYDAPVRGSPVAERGRRKTREEDDKARDVVAAAEEEIARSRSSKSVKKAKTKAKENPTDHAAQPPTFTVVQPPQAAAPSLPAGLGFGLPSSPRAPMLGGLQSPLQGNMPSIAGTLNPASQSTLSVHHHHHQQHQPTQHHMALPPKSPGLPSSPRPTDRPMNAPVPRLPKEALMSPGPMSPRSGLPLSPRAPRGPIPLPQSANPLAATTPYLTFNDSSSQNGPATSLAERLAHPHAAAVGTDPHLTRKDSRGNKPGDIFKGFVTEQYPGLLLPPNALPLIDIEVHSSRLRPSRQSYMATKNVDEEPILTLAVHSRSDNQQLWRVEKSVAALGMLNYRMRDVAGFQGRLPDKKAFTSHAPVHVDARRMALHEYFETLLDTPMDDKAALVVSEFFSTNVIGSKIDWSATGQDQDSGVALASTPDKPPRKEGFLSKKGKQFGGWKQRYFVLEDAQLKYFEAPNGSMLGFIKLHRAQIAKQNSKDSSDDAEYRHAFAVLERRRRDSNSMIRHVLCAETDGDRDAWVDALVWHIGDDDFASLVDPGSPRSPAQTPKFAGEDFKQPSRPRENSDPSMQLQGTSYEQTEAGEPPNAAARGKTSSTPSPTQPSQANPQSNNLHPTISGPVGGGPIQNASAWGNKSLSAALSREQKKRSMFGFITRSSEDSPGTPKHRDRSANRVHAAPVVPVFGIPLAMAAEICPPVGLDICLPAPVYRTIEYLQAKNAASEEGIFRLSGSNLTVKGLRERFNAEGDVKLLDGAYYDIHAVAGLLKLYLRELPETVLTKELHLDFLRVLDLDETAQKVAAINILVHRLPEANHELLATLSRFLLSVVSNADVNKMNVRNVGIVFAPTLNVPAPLISLFLTDHEAIFAADTSGDTASTASPVLDSIATPSPASEMDIRSPRKQMFTDVATPSFNQTSFHHAGMGLGMMDKSAYDTGFTPMATTAVHQHEVPAFYQYQPRDNAAAARAQQQRELVSQIGGEGYGSLNAVVSSSSGGGNGHNKTLSPPPSSLPLPPPPPPPPPPAGGDAGADERAVRKGRRESSIFVNGSGGGMSSPLSSSSSSSPGISAGAGGGGGGGSGGDGKYTLEGRRKSSYQRLREMTGLSDVREA